MPGSVNSMLSGRHVAEASTLVREILGMKFGSEGKRMEIPSLIAKYMADSGAELYQHKFQSQRRRFHPLNFSDSVSPELIHQNDSCYSAGVNSVGIIRASRGDGKEAIVLVTPYNAEKIELIDALSLGLGYSVFSLLSKVAWLAKDIVWVAADSRYGEYAAVSAWLRDYHNPFFIVSSKDLEVDLRLEDHINHDHGHIPIKGRAYDVFRRAGTMAAALVIMVVDRKEEAERDTVTIHAEASNGQMPNLDLVNIVNYLAVNRQGLHVKVETAL